jgi:hypothetical protein
MNHVTDCNRQTKKAKQSANRHMVGAYGLEAGKTCHECQHFKRYTLRGGKYFACTHARKQMTQKTMVEPHYTACGAFAPL